MRISVSFSRLLLNWVATYRHNLRVIIPNSSSVRYIWLNDEAASNRRKLDFISVAKEKKNLTLMIYNSEP